MKQKNSTTTKGKNSPSLTARQKAIYEFLKDKILNRGYGPTVREIGSQFGIQSLNGVKAHLKALEKKGLITRESHLSQAISITDPVGSKQPGQLTGILSAWYKGQLQLQPGLDSQTKTRIQTQFDTLRDQLGDIEDTPSVEHEKTWNSEMNSRRCDLIDKKIGGTITDEERLELERLQRQAMAHFDNVAPPPIEGARELHEELLKKKLQSETKE